MVSPPIQIGHEEKTTKMSTRIVYEFQVDNTVTVYDKSSNQLGFSEQYVKCVKKHGLSKFEYTGIESGGFYLHMIPLDEYDVLEKTVDQDHY